MILFLSFTHRSEHQNLLALERRASDEFQLTNSFCHTLHGILGTSPKASLELCHILFTLDLEYDKTDGSDQAFSWCGRGTGTALPSIVIEPETCPTEASGEK